MDGVQAVARGNALMQASFPVNFELSFSILEPALGEYMSIFLLADDEMGEILELHTATEPGEQMGFYLFGNPVSGPVLQADYDSGWTTIVFRWVDGVVTVASHGSMVTHDMRGTSNPLPTAPWDAVLYFSNPQVTSAKGYVRHVHISGT
jgi:hypothetical protein